MMTALVMLQHVRNPDTVFTQTDCRAAADDSQIGLVPGERMTVHDLLLALLLPSADDAADDLAYNVGRGSVARFVALMNADARALGLAHTHYTTPIGLDTPGNYSSPDDLVLLARLPDAQLAVLPPDRRAPIRRRLTSGRYVRHIVNTDDLVGRVPWIHGVKTGHTAAAGYVLVSEGRATGSRWSPRCSGTTSEAARDANALSAARLGLRRVPGRQPGAHRRASASAASAV